MRVLILGNDTPLGQALVKRLVALARHETVTLSRSACRWKSERHAKKTVRRADSDIVVDIRIDAAADGSEQIHDLDLKRCRWVAKACHRNKLPYLYLSLSIFSKEAPNLITQMLGEMMEGGSLVLDNNLRGCPVAAGDGARVISAVLDQLSTGVEAWGTYHYCSSDTATYYEFAEALLAAASQFSEFSSSAVQLEQDKEGSRPLNRALDCHKILNTFAIKQVPWRSAVADIVKQYYADQT